MEMTYLAPILIHYFYVQVIQSRTAKVEDGLYRRRYRYTLVGRRHNVAIAKYIYGFLFQKFRSGFRDWCRKMQLKAGEQGAAVRRGFYHGFSHGIMASLEASKAKAEADAKALVPARDPNLDKFLDQIYDDLGKPRNQSHAINALAAQEGLREGKQVQIRAGLETETKSNADGPLALEHRR
jgi:hypothetical protein